MGLAAKATEAPKATEGTSLLAAKEDDGALEAGGVVDIFKLRNCGYLMQYFAVGLIWNGIRATMYGFFNAYLNAPAYVQGASSTLAAMPWSFKIFFAVLTDDD